MKAEKELPLDNYPHIETMESEEAKPEWQIVIDHMDREFDNMLNEYVLIDERTKTVHDQFSYDKLESF